MGIPVQLILRSIISSWPCGDIVSGLESQETGLLTETHDQEGRAPGQSIRSVHLSTSHNNPFNISPFQSPIAGLSPVKFLNSSTIPASAANLSFSNFSSLRE